MPHADLILTGGKIVTLDPRSRTVQALAIRGDASPRGRAVVEAIEVD